MNDRINVPGDLYAIVALHNLPYRIDDQCCANDPIKFTSHELFCLPHAKLFADSVIMVGKKRKVEGFFLGKFLMPCFTIGRNTKNHSAHCSDAVMIIAEIACFLRTARGHIFRIKVQHDPCTAILCKRMRNAVLIGQREGWCLHRERYEKNEWRRDW